MDTIGHIYGTTFWDSFEAVLWKICQYAHKYALHMNVLEFKLFLLGCFRSAGENMLAEKFSLLLDDLNRFRRSIKRNWRNLGEQLRKHSYIHTYSAYIKCKNTYLFGYQKVTERDSKLNYCISYIDIEDKLCLKYASCFCYGHYCKLKKYTGIHTYIRTYILQARTVVNSAINSTYRFFQLLLLY